VTIPPMHIWPPPQIRFDPKSRFARVNLDLFQISPRKSRRKTRLNWLGLIGFVTFVLAAIALLHDPRYWTLTALASLVYITIWTRFQPAVGPSSKSKAQPQEIVRQPQHGYLISFTATYEVVRGLQPLSISAPVVTGDGFSGSGDGGGGKGGSGGGGGGSCSGGCGGGGSGG
jgi:hypothetical protein